MKKIMVLLIVLLSTVFSGCFGPGYKTNGVKIDEKELVGKYLVNEGKYNNSSLIITKIGKNLYNLKAVKDETTSLGLPKYRSFHKAELDINFKIKELRPLDYDHPELIIPEVVKVITNYKIKNSTNEKSKAIDNFNDLVFSFGHYSSGYSFTIYEVYNPSFTSLRYTTVFGSSYYK